MTATKHKVGHSQLRYTLLTLVAFRREDAILYSERCEVACSGMCAWLGVMISTFAHRRRNIIGKTISAT